MEDTSDERTVERTLHSLRGGGGGHFPFGLRQHPLRKWHHIQGDLSRLRVSAIIAGSLALAGCGGGSGGTASPPDPDIGVESLELAVATGDLAVEVGGQLLRGSVSCGEDSCEVSFLGGTTTIDIDDIDPNSASARTSGERQRNGVSIGRILATQDGLRLNSYGVWGNYNGGSASLITGTLRGVSLRMTFPYSVGYSTGSNPVSGTASWTGAMAGVKVSSSSIGSEVTGDASMTANLEAASIGLAFTNISDQSGTSSPDMQWQNVPMRSGSFIAAGLDGRFYGPDHTEAGGVFKRNGIEGAFSLARE